MSAARAGDNRISGGQYLVFVVLRWLTVVSLALWLGGLIAIGAYTAPTTFHVIRETATTASLSAPDQNRLAGLIVGDTLRLFNSVCAGLSVVLLFSQILTIVLWPELPAPKKRAAAAAVRPPRDLSRVTLVAELILSLLLIGSLAYLALDLFPAMDAAQARGAMDRFDVLHHRYERISMGQSPVLCALLFLFIHNTANLGRR